MPRKKTRRYGDYTETINGELYGSVNLPLGNGKYRRKRKKVLTATEARQWAQGELDRHSNRAVSGDKIVFADLARWYEREFLIAPIYQDGKKLEGQRSWKAQRNRLKNISVYLDHYRLERLTVDVLRGYKRTRLQSVSIVSVNRDMALLRTMFKKAYRRKWIKENPFDHGENLIEMSLESARGQKITERLAKRLLARSRKWPDAKFHYLILVARNTGARPSELFPFGGYKNNPMPREPIIWQHVIEFDFKAVRLISYKGRIRRERIVPASIELEKGLRRFYAETAPKKTDLLFPQTNFKRGWKWLIGSLQLKNIVLRDFRRYYNTKLIDSKLDEVSRMMIMGHRDVAINYRYASITDDFIKHYRETVS